MNNLVEKAKKHINKSFVGVTYGDESYVDGHLMKVYNEGKKYTTDEDVLCALLLHDNIEDTSDTKKEIEELFNWNVANIVYNVTDGEGVNRKERKAAMYSKIKNSNEALRINSTFVKLIDRICNVKAGGKIDMYRKEQPAFKENLFRKNDKSLRFIWKELDELLQ